MPMQTFLLNVQIFNDAGMHADNRMSVCLFAVGQKL